MKKSITYLIVMILAVVLTAAKSKEQKPDSTATKQEAFKAAVLRVYDGDTVLVRYNGLECLIRLWGIDAPESKQTDGKEATKYLLSLIKSRTVKIVPVESGKYGRLVAKIYVKNKHVNLEMIKAGYAWWYKQYAPDAKDFEKAQEEAKAKKLGVWANDNPVNPSKWRYGRK
jgi:endonuclease YncB( thermonuclease family)